MEIRSWACACIVAVLFAAPAWGHHSRAMFTRPDGAITLAGTVKEISWSNPHVYLYVVVNKDGQVQNWALEGGSPYQLNEERWPSEKLKPGDKITVNVRPLISGGYGGLFRSIIFADGSKWNYVGATGN